MVDLSTTYLGLSLKNPLIASASPLSEKVENVRQLEEAGIAAVVMYSLFEEQILQEAQKLDRDVEQGTYSYAEALTYLPYRGPYRKLRQYSIGPDMYVENLSKLVKAVDIPILGSLNGLTTGGWIEYAKHIEQAGAAALELNLYSLPTDPQLTSSALEEEYLDLVRLIRASIKIPLSVKLSPFFSALPNFASQLVEAGVQGLVLFNRFYQPDFDLDNLEIIPNLILSHSSELRLPLRWIAILYGRIQADFALTSGVYSAHDVIKACMAGASVAMVASALLKYGIRHIETVLSDLQGWMEEKEYASIAQMKGSMSQQSVENPAAIERSNYMKVLASYEHRSAP